MDSLPLRRVNFVSRLFALSTFLIVSLLSAPALALPEFTLNDGDWSLITVPADPGPDGSPGLLFGDDLPVADYGVKGSWVMFAYDSAVDGYSEVAADQPLVANVAYWMVQATGEAVDIDVPDTLAAPSSNSQPGCIKGWRCASTGLAGSEGGINWNLAGASVDTAVAFGNTRFVTRSAVCSAGCTPDEAMAANVVGDAVFRYRADGAGSVYERVSSAGSLQPWEGYWLPVMGSASNATWRLPVERDGGSIPGGPGADSEVLDDDGLPVRTFKVERPAISGNSAYTIDINEWDIPDTGTNAAKTTENLQAAIDWAHEQGYTRVTLPKGEYLVGRLGNAVYQAGIEIRENTEFVFSAGAVLAMDTNDKWNYCVLSAEGNDIIIRDGVIRGDRDTHVYTPRKSDGSRVHDEGHGICIWKNNDRVLVENMELHSLTGDGALVMGAQNVTFTGNDIHDNRRQGISIVGGIRIAVTDNEIHHIKGTAPEFGIDIEGPGRVDEDILIQGNRFHHNRGGDVLNFTGDNVYILDNTMAQGENGKYVDGPIRSWHKTHSIIARNTMTMVDGSRNGRLGFIQYSRGGAKGHNRAIYVHENTCNSCGMYMYDSSDADIRRNRFLGYFAAFTDFEDVILIDNLVTYSEKHPKLRFCWSYRFSNATGLASGNYLGESSEELPLSLTEPYTMPCVVKGF